MDVHVEVRGQTQLSFSGKPSASLTQALSLAWSSPIRLDCLFSKSQRPSVSSSSALGSQDSAILLDMFLCVPGMCGSWGLNSDPCDCKASALLAEPSSFKTTLLVLCHGEVIMSGEAVKAFQILHANFKRKQ